MHAARRVDKDGNEIDAEGTVVPMDPKVVARLDAYKRASKKRTSKKRGESSTQPEPYRPSKKPMRDLFDFSDSE